MSTTHTLTLAGCAPVPLAHYLKALGILRLVSEQKDPKATGRWHRDQFILTSTLDREALLKFFLEEYQPSPVIAPWNGGSGFYRSDNRSAIDGIRSSGAERLDRFRAAIQKARRALAAQISNGRKTTRYKSQANQAMRKAVRQTFESLSKAVLKGIAVGKQSKKADWLSELTSVVAADEAVARLVNGNTPTLKLLMDGLKSAGYSTRKRLVGLIRSSQAFSEACRDAREKALGKLLDVELSETKSTLLADCRNVLPESAIEWLDAAYVLTEGGPKYPPLLGTGGNDGRLEFTNNFMQRITEVMDVATGKAVEDSSPRLCVSLFADALATPLSKAPVGQFLPGTAGGANATCGFDAASAVNPWDFILMIEGALLFASASVKRLESADTGALAYPFCVRQAGVGYASATSSDESASRSEMWLPVWTQRAVTLPELSTIFSEGRSQVGTRAARNGVDFARAVVGLGVDRGLDEFQRYGFQVRNGLSYFATPLTRVSAKKNATVDLLSDVDVWLDRYRRAATKDTAPASARRALSVLESQIFDLCTSHTPERLSAVFIALGQCEATAARSLKWATAKENYLQPLFGLRKAWLDHGWNSSIEFRLAASLSSISGKFGKDWLPLRCHLEQVTSYFDKESGTLAFRWADVPSNHVQWSEAALPDVLNAITSRRLILSEEPPQSRSEVWASVSDIKAFIEGETNDALLSDLLWSMSLINWRERAELPTAGKERQPVPPTLYALLKLCFPPVRTARPDGILPVPTVPAIHRQASQGNGDQAAMMAIRRLRASGYHPVLTALPVKGDYARRTAAALLFPISDRTLTSIHKQTTRPEPESATT